MLLVLTLLCLGHTLVVATVEHSLADDQTDSFDHFFEFSDIDSDFNGGAKKNCDDEQLMFGLARLVEHGTSNYDASKLTVTRTLLADVEKSLPLCMLGKQHALSTMLGAKRLKIFSANLKQPYYDPKTQSWFAREAIFENPLLKKKLGFSSLSTSIGNDLKLPLAFVTHLTKAEGGHDSVYVYFTGDGIDSPEKFSQFLAVVDHQRVAHQLIKSVMINPKDSQGPENDLGVKALRSEVGVGKAGYVDLSHLSATGQGGDDHQFRPKGSQFVLSRMPALFQHVEKLLGTLGKDASITVAGWSGGSSLATLFVSTFSENKLDSRLLLSGAIQPWKQPLLLKGREAYLMLFAPVPTLACGNKANPQRPSPLERVCTTVQKFKTYVTSMQCVAGQNQETCDPTQTVVDPVPFLSDTGGQPPLLVDDPRGPDRYSRYVTPAVCTSLVKTTLDLSPNTRYQPPSAVTKMLRQCSSDRKDEGLILDCQFHANSMEYYWHGFLNSEYFGPGLQN